MNPAHAARMRASARRQPPLGSATEPLLRRFLLLPSGLEDPLILPVGSILLPYGQWSQSGDVELSICEAADACVGVSLTHVRSYSHLSDELPTCCSECPTDETPWRVNACAMSTLDLIRTLRRALTGVREAYDERAVTELARALICELNENLGDLGIAEVTKQPALADEAFVDLDETQCGGMAVCS